LQREEFMEVVGGNPNPKNIVLCFDGTGDWAGTNRTNVMEIFHNASVVPGEQATPDVPEQKVFYYGGVGTLANATALWAPKRLLLKLLDLAVATSLRDTVLEGYTRLANEYRHGDRIYLIGFSRGAFAARLVAAMVHTFGLLEKRSAHLAPYLWQAISNPEPFDKFMEESARIKKTFAAIPHPPIHFLGLFDTVSSVGIFERFKVFPFATTNPSVEIIRHAVSKDETRNAFPEQLVVPANNDVLEVWFDGVHRDVGGGAPDNQGYENITLDWMVTELEKAGMLINRMNLPPKEKTKLHDGGFDPYVLVGLYPQLMFDHELRNRRKINYSFARFWTGFLQVLAAMLGLLFGKPWPRLRSAKNDPGFRYRWPNFKHVRRIPSNALQLTSYDDTAPIGQRFTYMAEATPGLIYKDKPAQPIPPVEDCFPFSFHDFIGTFLGVGLAFLMANKMLGQPFGESWPRASAVGAFWIFVIFLVQQGLSHKIARSKLAFLNTVVPAAGLGLAAWLCVTTIRQNGHWDALIAAGIAGGIATLLAQAPFYNKWPFVRADRAIPFFILPWFLAGLFLRFAEPVWSLVAPPVVSSCRWLFSWTMPVWLPPLIPLAGVLWLVFVLIRAQKKTPAKKKKETVSAVAGILLWALLALIVLQREAIFPPLSQALADWWHPLDSWIRNRHMHAVFTPIAWAAAAIAAVSGAWQLIEDRVKMLPPKKGPAEPVQQVRSAPHAPSDQQGASNTGHQ
jgi:hypothetical protein